MLARKGPVASAVGLAPPPDREGRRTRSTRHRKEGSSMRMLDKSMTAILTAALATAVGSPSASVKAADNPPAVVSAAPHCPSQVIRRMRMG